MDLCIRFRSTEEAQNYMKFLQNAYPLIIEMEKYSIDAEKRVQFFTGEATNVKSQYNTTLISTRFKAGMPLHAMFIFCWLAVKSSYRNKNSAPIVYVNTDLFEITFAYQTAADRQKVLVDYRGLCDLSEENSIMSYFMNGTTGIFNLINKKLQDRHIEHILLCMNELEAYHQKYFN